MPRDIALLLALMCTLASFLTALLAPNPAPEPHFILHDYYDYVPALAPACRTLVCYV